MIKNGIIAIDKPEGISSSSVVAKVKKKLGVKKAGHTGTLDPFATGLLLCGINKGTKLSQFFLGSDKSYIAEILLGVETDTQDYTGQIINKSDPLIINSISKEKIIDTVQQFQGEQMQTPPIYSALKHNGVPLYKLARQGESVQKPPRKITIHSIEVLSIEIQKEISDLFFNKILSLNKNLFLYSKSSKYISVKIFVHCSSGTYIRTIADDIGKKLNCFGTLISLRRTKTCTFSIDQAISLNQFEDMPKEEASNKIISMADALSFMPVIYADDKLADAVRFGREFKYLQAEAEISNYYNTIYSNIKSNVITGLDEDFSYTLHSNLYFKVVNTNGDLIAIVKYNAGFNKYDYCCVFIN